MVINKKQHLLFSLMTIVLVCGLLTGCPWGQMKYYADETAHVYQKGDEVCFLIPDAGDYQPIYLSVNPRGTPAAERKFTALPSLKVVNGEFCLPPSFRRFPATSLAPFIVHLVLRSQSAANHPRNFVIGFSIINNQVHDAVLTSREFDRPSMQAGKQ